ncbi:MAG: hypothetical protein ACR2PO_12915 [Methyloligellaceae bacterium]
MCKQTIQMIAVALAFGSALTVASIGGDVLVAMLTEVQTSASSDGIAASVSPAYGAERRAPE